MSFSKLKLSEPVLKAVAEAGYTAPTAIQKQAIPVILSGRDLLAAAQTGTGKTASFVLPMLEMIDVERQQRGKRIRALILTPTRELAIPVAANVVKYSKYLNPSSSALVGGGASEPQ